MFFNPTSKPMTRTIALPLYYTGLTNVATIINANGEAKKYTINRDYSVDFTFTIEADTYNWFVIE